MCFRAQPVTLAARRFWLLMGWAFVGPTRKAMQKDLADLKALLEGTAAKAGRTVS